MRSVTPKIDNRDNKSNRQPTYYGRKDSTGKNNLSQKPVYRFRAQDDGIKVLRVEDEGDKLPLNKTIYIQAPSASGKSGNTGLTLKNQAARTPGNIKVPSPVRQLKTLHS